MEDVDFSRFIGRCSIQVGVLEAGVQDSGGEFFIKMGHRHVRVKGVQLIDLIIRHFVEDGLKQVT